MSLVARRSSLVARRSSLIVLVGLLSKTAEANCPNGLNPATDCRALCALNTTTHYYDCNMDNAGSGSAATAYAVSDYTTGYHSVFGPSAGDGAAFCCEVLGSSVGKLFLTGTAQADYLAFQYQGMYLDDLASGMEGIANGLDGNDDILGSLSTDAAYRDTLNGQNGEDEIWGDEGDDYIYGNAQVDVCWGGGGADTIEGGAGMDEIHGGAGADALHGGEDGDYILGDAGDDLMWGEGSKDTLRGGDGNDTLRGGDYDDYLCGEDGDDALYGEGYTWDTLWGGAGTDTNNGGVGAEDACGSPWLGSTACEVQLTSNPGLCSS